MRLLTLRSFFGPHTGQQIHEDLIDGFRIDPPQHVARGGCTRKIGSCFWQDLLQPGAAQAYPFGDGLECRFPCQFCQKDARQKEWHRISLSLGSSRVRQFLEFLVHRAGFAFCAPPRQFPGFLDHALVHVGLVLVS
jgi:hypothetical protein